MLEALTGKVFASIVSLSMFLFSSYTGNDPSLRALTSRVGDNYLQLRTSLVSAFDNDFPDVFKSGATIPIEYKLLIKSGKQTRVERKFQNRVRFDPLTGVYHIYSAGMNRNTQTTSYPQMITEISAFECSVPYNPAWGKVSVRLEASLPIVRFQQLNKPVDLMVLWRYQRPAANVILNLQSAS